MKKKDFIKTIDSLSTTKSMAENAFVGIFIFHTPSLGSIKKYLDACDFEKTHESSIPDFICGLGKFFLEKGNVVLDKNSEPTKMPPRANGIAYLNYTYETKHSGQDYTFEAFFYRLYQHLEIRINQELKNGIDNVWEIKGDKVARPHGRVRFATISLNNIEMVSFVKRSTDTGGSEKDIIGDTKKA